MEVEMAEERVLCAALLHPFSMKIPMEMEGVDSGFCVLGCRHSDAMTILKYLMVGLKEDFKENEIVEGFMTNKCRFVTRAEAMKIAKSAGQVNISTQGVLSSEIFNK